MTAAQDAADLALAVQAATQAGAGLMRHWAARADLTITTKRAGDFLSQADVEAEACLRAVLLGANPTDG